MPDFSDTIKDVRLGEPSRVNLDKVCKLVAALAEDGKIRKPRDVVSFLQQAVPQSKHQTVYATSKAGRLNVKFETTTSRGERYQYGFYFVDERVYAAAKAAKQHEGRR